ncbi:MAG: LPS-assembly protein LptD, partial [Paramuribaculum sp.]|nr:LPS-assembly protein LptD [Paramuribaculum sp.]
MSTVLMVLSSLFVSRASMTDRAFSFPQASFDTTVLRPVDSIVPPTATTDRPGLLPSERRRRVVSQATDSTDVDSVSTESLGGAKPGDTPAGGPRIVRAKVDLDNPVDFSSQDSIRMEGTNKAYLFGQGQVTYGSIKLDAEQIDMDINKSMVYAVGRADSTGEVIGLPVFDDHGQTYESKTMTYNFDTGRGYITDVITQQGEGYLTGGQTKKVGDNVFYTQDGKYTTCDDHDHPHFYMQLTKAKIRPGKDIVTGPAYMVLAGLPLP